MAVQIMHAGRMRTDITVTADDRAQLERLVADRNTPTKAVWRARIVLANACGDSQGDRASDGQVEAVRVALGAIARMALTAWCAGRSRQAASRSPPRSRPRCWPRPRARRRRLCRHYLSGD